MLRRLVKYAVATILAAGVLLISCGIALATGTTTVNMSGQAAVVGTEESPQLRIRIGAAGSPGWLIEVALNPTLINYPRYGDNTTPNLSGSFTLGTPGYPLASGAATGRIDRTGVGDIKLTDAKSGTQLDIPYAISSDGSVTAQAQGTWPALPTPPSSTSVTSPSAQGAQTTQPQPSNHFFWYLSRTAGILAFVLLFVNMCLGLSMRSRLLDQAMGRWRAYDLHQFTALLAMALLGLHIFALLGDSYFNYSAAQLLLPFESPYRPAWVALGVICLYLTAVGVVSIYLRRKFSRRAWRVLHAASILLFFGVLVHSVKSGTDSAAAWSQWMYISTGVIVVFLFLWRYADAVLGWFLQSNPAG